MRVCIAGGGTAGLEALLAAHEQLGDQAELVLVAPEPDFIYRPMSRDSLFRPAAERRLAVSELVDRAGATWVADRVAAVHDDERCVLTGAGDRVQFDFLLVAVGAQARPALRQGHTWLRGADPSFLDQIMLSLRAGEAHCVAIVVPRGARWPIPAYELALVLGWSAPGAVTLITAAEAPLELLGSGASQLIAHELGGAGVETVLGTEARDDLEPEATERPQKPRLRLGGGEVREFDHLICLPTIVGPFLAGTPVDAAGFVEVDEGLRACGCERIYAAGSCLSAALEHSAVAAGQADAAVSAIVAAGGGRPPGGVGAQAQPPGLTGILLSEQREAWLAENPLGTAQPSTRCLWWPPGHAVGRMLSQHIAAWNPALQPPLPSHLRGLPVRAPIALGCSARPFLAPDREPDAETRRLRLREVERRQLMAVRRQEHAAEAELRTLRLRLDQFAAHEHDVIRELRAHGYLSDFPSPPR